MLARLSAGGLTGRDGNLDFDDGSRAGAADRKLATELLGPLPHAGDSHARFPLAELRRVTNHADSVVAHRDGNLLFVRSSETHTFLACACRKTLVRAS